MRTLQPLHALLAGLASLAAAYVLLEVVERPASAGTAIELDVAGLADHAELIVEGRVLSAVALEEQGLVHTEYRVALARTLLGVPQAERVLRWPGGVLPDGRGLLVPGLPHLAPGEDVLLFLSAESSRGLRVPVGLGQGRFLVARPSTGGRVLVRSHGDLALADAQGGLRQARSTAVFDYATVIAEIEAALAARRARGGANADRRAEGGR